MFITLECRCPNKHRWEMVIPKYWFNPGDARCDTCSKKADRFRFGSTTATAEDIQAALRAKSPQKEGNPSYEDLLPKDEKQDDFDQTIGRLDHVLSKMVIWGKDAELELPNKQTLKHHAEDMIAAGNKILKDLGKEVQATPQPD